MATATLVTAQTMVTGNHAWPLNDDTTGALGASAAKDIVGTQHASGGTLTTTGSAVADNAGLQRLNGRVDRWRSGVSPTDPMHLATHGLYLAAPAPPEPSDYYASVHIVSVPGEGKFLAYAKPPTADETRVGGIPGADADPLLRSAVVLEEVRKRQRNPWFWGAFVVHGDPGVTIR